MRFLHIADLHLGRQLGNVSLLEDQIFILSQLKDIAQEQRVSAVLISGDVYQRQAPQAEAMAAFDAFVSELVACGMQVFIISGNHDSALRLGYFAGLLQKSGVYLSEVYDGSLKSVSLKDEYGPVTLWLMPYLKPGQVRRALGENGINSYQDAVKAALKCAAVDERQRNILLCHQYITGAELSDSEELAIGGLDNIDAGVFDAFDYVALGHIHKPQRVGRDTMRYAGSPLKYSFSEAAHKKSACVVEMGRKGDVQISLQPLYPLRDLRLIKGKMSDIMRMPYSEDYVWITLTDERVMPDAAYTLRTAFPNMLKQSVENSHSKYDLSVTGMQSLQERSMLELFDDFYRLQNNDRPLDEAQTAYLKKIMAKLEDAQ